MSDRQAEASLAREQIRDIVARYNIGGDDHDLAALVATFTEDALYESAIFRCVGRDAIREWLAASWRRAPDRPGPRFRRHHITTTRIDLAGPTNATGLIYYLVMTDLGPDHCGYYRDDYRLTGDGWRIARRGVWMEWVDEASRFVPDESKRILRETGDCGPAR